MYSAYLFPGQGSQKVSMGYDLYEKTNIGKKYFDQANDIMGYDIKDIIFNGPDEKLKETTYTQPAIYIVTQIIAKIIIEKRYEPKIVA